MSNSNLNNENVKTEIINGKVYMIIGNKRIFMRNLKPQNQRVSLIISGPGTYFKNNEKRQKNAINIVNSTRQNQLNKSKQLAKKGNRYVNIKFLSSGYVRSKLQNVGKQSIRNYAALNNRGNLKGFAIISNSPTRNTNRSVNVIATIPGIGTGRQLMQRIIKNAKNNGKTRIVLNATKTAIPFYEKMGFRKVGNANKYISMNYMIRV